MCGFAGIVAWDQKHRVDRAVLSRMSAQIAHRGPDGEGIWEDAREGQAYVGLVHRRLAIIDLDERANQPFCDNQGRWLIFNGEIYNYRELRRKLERLLPDYPWRTQSDTEVLLASYAAWGQHCVNHLTGMFAFAVWDANQQTLFIARDRMGQKPLYCAAIPSAHPTSLDTSEHSKPISAIAFASELNALLQIPWVDRTIALPQVTNYLKFGYIFGDPPQSNTIFQGVQNLPPATSRLITPQFQKQTRYFWQSRDEDLHPPDEHDLRYSDSQAITLTRDLLTQAVQSQLVADVPVGCFLSGGVDSSIIAAVMARHTTSGQKILTFSIAFDDPRYDESQYARRVADHLKTSHHQFIVQPNAASDLPALAAAFGEPFADSSALPTYYLARETRRKVKVALSGDGGDELFGGYERYRAMALARQLRTLATPLPWRALSKVFNHSGHPKSTWTRFKRFARSITLPDAQRYSNYMRIFPQDLLVELLGGSTTPQTNFDLIQSHFTIRNSDLVRQSAYVDRETYLPNDLLVKVDRCSMLHSLEVRSPFMDHPLVQFASRLRSSQLLKGGPKRMLREAFSDHLPAWVFKRKKMGFAVPIGEWFRASLRPMLHDHLFASNSFAASHFHRPVLRRLVDEHDTQRIDHSQRLYALLMLELWWKSQRK